MAELIGRRRLAGRPVPATGGGDLGWLVLVGGTGAIALGWLTSVSLQAACAAVAVVVVLAVHERDRRWGVVALFALWFLAPWLRRVLALATGPVENDPLSLAPFLATAVLGAIELVRSQAPLRSRRILMVAALGFAIGLPVGLLSGPRSALYALVAYVAALGAAVLGSHEPDTAQESTLRRVLLYGMAPIAAYAIAQRALPLAEWDRLWVDTTSLISLGAEDEGTLRVFGTLNSHGALAPLLALSLLCYLTVARAGVVAIAGAATVAVALALTNVRSAWVALAAAGLAHVVASHGRSARLVLGAGAVLVAATLALAPVSPAARGVLDRAVTIGDEQDDSRTARSTSFSRTLPVALQAPMGHGLGSAGEPSKLTGASTMRAPDNGYLGLVYQVGPVGFLLVAAALAVVVRAAWRGAQARAPGQDLRLLLFAMVVFLLVQMTAGDVLYGSQAVVLWFIAGQVLAYERRRRAAIASPYTPSSRSTTRDQA